MQWHILNMMSVEHASAGYQANTEDDAETTVVLLEAIPQEDDVEDNESVTMITYHVTTMSQYS